MGNWCLLKGSGARGPLQGETISDDMWSVPAEKGVLHSEWDIASCSGGRCVAESLLLLEDVSAHVWWRGPWSDPAFVFIPKAWAVNADSHSMTELRNPGVTTLRKCFCPTTSKGEEGEFKTWSSTRGRVYPVTSSPPERCVAPQLRRLDVDEKHKPRPRARPGWGQTEVRTQSEAGQGSAWGQSSDQDQVLLGIRAQPGFWAQSEIRIRAQSWFGT